MRRLAAVVVLAAFLTAACAQPAAVPAPTAVSTPTPTPTPTEIIASVPPGPVTVDLTVPVKKNKLYKAGKVPVVQCALPRPNLSTEAGMLAYARVFVACLTKAWAPVIARSDALFDPPRVFAYSLRHLSATPECAEPPDDAGGFYSGGDICFAWEDYVIRGNSTRSRVLLEDMLAHEYGHHVQGSVGILGAYWTDSKSKAVQLENSRRLELQASCLGAAFLGANRSTLRLTGLRLQIWRDIVHNTGDVPKGPRDHGSNQSYSYWSLRAFDTANPASCNTFTAPPKRVS